MKYEKKKAEDVSSKNVIVHEEIKKVKNGKTYYQAEVVTNGGTHEIWIEKSKLKNISIAKDKKEQYEKKKVTCLECDKQYFEMVKGDISKFNFRCKCCSGEGVSMFGKK